MEELKKTNTAKTVSLGSNGVIGGSNGFMSGNSGVMGGSNEAVIAKNKAMAAKEESMGNKEKVMNEERVVNNGKAVSDGKAIKDGKAMSNSKTMNDGKAVMSKEPSEGARKKLTYEQLNDACNQLWQQNRQLMTRNRELEQFMMNKRLEYLFKVVELNNRSSSDFVVSCANEIEEALTIPQKGEESSQEGD